MNLLRRAERTDRAAAEAVAPLRENGVVRLLGWASELADQPQLVSICVGTIAGATLARNAKLARAGAGMLAAELIATQLKSLIKHRVDRTRPHVPADGGRYRLEPGDSEASAMNSFPSGHTAGAVAVAGVVAQAYPQHRAAAFTVAAMVAAIQVPRCKHYPSDLAAGALIGVAAGGLGCLIVDP